MVVLVVRYCQPCPQGVKIPYTFLEQSMVTLSLVIKKRWFGIMNRISLIVKEGPEGCVKCGLCEKRCPQHLSIREDLQKSLKIYKEVKASLK
jgi:predicted aldo/keto reductase-like oxidoreductase